MTGRRIAVALALLAAVLGNHALTAPPAEASKLPPGLAAWHVHTGCSSWSVYQTNGANLTASQEVAPLPDSCGAPSQVYVTLTFFDPVFGLLNVGPCQAGLILVPSVSGIGTCTWNSNSQTITASWYRGSNAGQVAFGMRVQHRANKYAGAAYHDDSYSAFG